MYEKKIGIAATSPKMMRSVVIGMLRTSRNRAATNAATTAPTAANVVFIHATARYSSGRSRMCALRRLSSSSGSLPVRAWTNFPNMRQATCAFGGRLTFTGLAPFGSFTMWAPFSDSSPGRVRFVFVSVPRVSSFSNAELANGLAPCLDRVRDEFVRLRLKPDELDDLLHPSHDRVPDPGVGLDDDEVQGSQQDARGVDRRVL